MSASSRADLLRLLNQVPAARRDAIAEQVGFSRRKQRQFPETSGVESVVETQPGPTIDVVVPPHQEIPAVSGPQYWRVIEHEALTPALSDGPGWWQQATPLTDHDPVRFHQPPRAHSNLHWPRMEGFLRQQLLHRVCSRRPDETWLTRRLAECKPVHRFPRKLRARWPQSTIVIQDWSESIFPIREDQLHLMSRMQKLIGPSVVPIRVNSNRDRGLPDLIQALKSKHITAEQLSCSRLVLVSDFATASGDRDNQDRWHSRVVWLKRLAWQQPLLTLNPMPPACVPSATANLLTQFYWDRNAPLVPHRLSPNQGQPVPVEPVVEELVMALSVTALARPRLLRKLRDFIRKPTGVCHELMAWNYRNGNGEHEVLHYLPHAYVHPEFSAKWQSRFLTLGDAAHRQRIFDCIEEDHRSAPRHDRAHEAILHRALLREEDFGSNYLSSMIYSLTQDDDHSDDEREQWIRWADRLVSSVPADVVKANQQLNALTFVVDQIRSERGETAVSRTDTRPDYLYHGRPARSLTIWQQGAGLGTRPVDESPKTGSPIATVQTVDGVLAVLSGDSVRENFWEGTPPDWVVDYGEDRYGLWMRVSVGDVDQTFRWIVPGTYVMGSPETEPERHEDEHQHEVTLSEGYWLAETACTQALWQAVIGENQSHFKGEERPVETVSWDDTQGFIERLNERVKGLGVRLPTEAEWEYGCRAGSEVSEPYSFGRNITPDQVNYDGRYPYANGEKGEERGTTVDVKTLPSNGWGLYEMHGNVWEWCSDGYGAYADGPVTDPKGLTSTTSRVLRGGSWIHRAEGARSAARSADVPGHRYGDIGFRLARGQ